MIEKRTYIKFWILVQTILLITPIMIGLVMVPYEIEKDKIYLERVGGRSFESNDKLTDFKEAKVAEADLQGKFVQKVWMQENKELYYLYAIGYGFTYGLVFQLFNLLWVFFYVSEIKDY
jgi:hypothetical protein